MNLCMSKPADINAPPSRAILPRIATSIAAVVVFALLWFGIAGRLTWWQAWTFLLVLLAYVGALFWRLSRLNPELLQERNLPADKAEGWDRVVMALYSAILLILLITTALDAGRHLWSSVPLGIQLVGWLLLIFAGATVWHVMMTNAYLSSWARIQQDRDQVVVQRGAYSRIRHPMYLGIIVAFLGMPLALGSWWALIPSMLIVALFIYRTHREDLMLVHGLTGYVEYTRKVRYRLLPGIW